MLISYSKYKFIFVHIYKNAGTSIRKALDPYLYSCTQKVFINLFASAGISIYKKIILKDHATALDIINEIGYINYNKYFSFAVVRNPWDWQVSQYYYMLKKENHPQHNFVKSFGSFDAYIEWRCQNEVVLQRDFIYSATGNLLVNYVARYENIANEFAHICNNIGIDVKLPKLNVSNKINYKTLYNKHTKKLIEESFHYDIETFRYKY